MARQRLYFLMKILVLVLVLQSDVLVAVPGPDGEALPVETAVIKASEGAARSDGDSLDVIPVPVIYWVPPFEHHL